ncbi:MAG: hypothetical protein KDD55_11275, partial [Bdellovibrionales bacterium]|nr:hypothetical protein [Bdellovibrionales bacterium]
VQQQIWPFYFYSNPEVFRNDPIAHYYLACLPQGFKALYRVWTVFSDPILLSTYLPYLLYFFAVLGMWRAAYLIGGGSTAWLTLLLFLSCGIYLDRMTGGLPRSFGFPILIWTIYALIAERHVLLGVLALLGAAFYPTAGLISGACLALALLTEKFTGTRARKHTFGEALRLLLLFGLLSSLAILPTLLNAREFGEKIPMTSVEEFPELGEHGRYQKWDRYPWPTLSESVRKGYLQGVSGVGAPLVPIGRKALESVLPLEYLLLLLGGLGLLTLFAWTSIERVARRLVLYFIASFGVYYVATWIAPHLYIPQRYLSYALPPFGALLVGYGISRLSRLGEKMTGNRVSRTALSFVAVFVIAVLVGNHSRVESGLKISLARAEQEVLKEISTLPSGALIASYPHGVINAVPLVSKRRVLVSLETYQVFHRKYALLMRERMNALLDAYYSGSVEKLLALSDRYGVTHLLRVRTHFKKDTVGLFEPFRPVIREAIAYRKEHGDELEQYAKDAVVYSFGRHTLWDLKRLRQSVRAQHGGAQTE